MFKFKLFCCTFLVFFQDVVNTNLKVSKQYFDLKQY